MTKKLCLTLFVLLLLPATALAHETRVYEINGVEYEIIVGSVVEPAIVDDRNGVSVEIVRDGAFFVGAQDMLQVEISAGEQKRTLSLNPLYGYQGQYKANFIPTVPTTMTYRVFGTLENVPVNLSFECNPAGHPKSEDVLSPVEISDVVTQTVKKGSFGCPEAREDFTFPEKTEGDYQLSKEVSELQNVVNKNASSGRTTTALSLVALLLALASLGLVVATTVRKK